MYHTFKRKQGHQTAIQQHNSEYPTGGKYGGIIFSNMGKNGVIGMALYRGGILVFWELSQNHVDHCEEMKLCNNLGLNVKLKNDESIFSPIKKRCLYVTNLKYDRHGRSPFTTFNHLVTALDQRVLNGPMNV